MPATTGFRLPMVAIPTVSVIASLLISTPECSGLMTPADDAKKLFECNFTFTEDGQKCNLTFSEDVVARYNSYGFRPGTGEDAIWVGGPQADAQESRVGGYAYFDTSLFFNPSMSPPLLNRAWLLSPAFEATEAQGRCLTFKVRVQSRCAWKSGHGTNSSMVKYFSQKLTCDVLRMAAVNGSNSSSSISNKFQYNLRGLSTGSLRLVRVDLVAEREVTEGGDLEEDLEWHEAAAEEILEAVEDLPPVSAMLQEPESRNALDRYQVTASLAWSTSDVTDGWKDAHCTYSTPLPHVFIWELQPRLNWSDKNSFRGFGAIDSVLIHEGPCTGECNFNVDTCDYSNLDTVDDFDWGLARGSHKAVTGPAHDQGAAEHGHSAGAFAFIDSARPRRPGDSALLVLVAEVPPGQGPLCLVFWVSLYGGGLGDLRIYFPPANSSVEEFSNASYLYWELSNPVSSSRGLWNKARLTIPDTGVARKIVFYASVGEVGRSDYAIDTIQIQDGACPVNPESVSPDSSSARYSYDCTFRMGLCHWTTVNIPNPWIQREDDGSNDDAVVLENSDLVKTSAALLWSRVKGGTSGVPPGHTRLYRGETDFLMSLDIRSSQYRPLDSAYLVSSLIVPERDSFPTKCVAFWFYMAADTGASHQLGMLRLLETRNNSAVEEVLDAPKRTIWSVTNHQRSQWQYAQTQIQPPAPGSRLIFEGVRARSVSGTIAIDDIAVFDGECKTLPAHAIPSVHDCSFSSSGSSCSWQAVNPDEGQELRIQDWKVAGDGNAGLEDLKDHTFGIEGRGFVFFNTSENQILTQLKGVPLETGKSFCLTFWFAVDAGVNASLAVKRQDQAGLSTLLWKVGSSSMDEDYTVGDWVPAQVLLPSQEETSTVIFEGSSNKGGFALDDILILENAELDNCPTRPAYQLDSES